MRLGWLDASTIWLQACDRLDVYSLRDTGEAVYLRAESISSSEQDILFYEKDTLYSLREGGIYRTVAPGEEQEMKFIARRQELEKGHTSAGGIRRIQLVSLEDILYIYVERSDLTRGLYKADANRNLKPTVP